jgi:CBS domain-containing protein
MEISDKVHSVLDFKGRDLYSVHPNASVYDAIELMSEKGVGALLVMKGESLAGIISERDYARKIILKGRSSRDTRVEEVMSTEMVYAHPNDTVDECMRLMTANRIRHLPVVDGTRVVGILSIGDLVKWIISAQAETIGHLHNYIAGAYPG